MEIKINRDLNSYKSKDIGMFSLQEAGYITVALAVSGVALWAEKQIFGEFWVITVLFTAVPILAPCFLKIKGHKLINYIKLINKPQVYKKKSKKIEGNER